MTPARPPTGSQPARPPEALSGCFAIQHGRGRKVKATITKGALRRASFDPNSAKLVTHPHERSESRPRRTRDVPLADPARFLDRLFQTNGREPQGVLGPPRRTRSWSVSMLLPSAPTSHVLSYPGVEDARFSAADDASRVRTRCRAETG